MESGPPGKRGLLVLKHVAMGRGTVYDCVTIPPRLMEEKLVKARKKIQKFVLFAIAQVNQIFIL